MIEEQDIHAMVFERKPGVDDESKLTQPIQSAKENPCLEIRQGQFVFRMTNEAGGLVERFISSAQVREAFAGAPIDTGWMAPQIMRWGNGRLGEWAVGFVPPQVHELELQLEKRVCEICEKSEADPMTPDELCEAHIFKPATSVDRIRVPLPGLVWFGHGTSYFIFAVKTDTLQPYQEIYRAPLPNTYGDGSICWGVVKPERMTAASLFKAYDLFMGTTFNNHLANAKSKLYREDVRLMLRKLTDCPGFRRDDLSEPYPVDDLVRQVPHTGVTLDQAVRSYFEGGGMPS